MKVFRALFLLGLFDVCWARSMQPIAIKKRFKEAKYAFKFRVTSEVTEECFPDSAAVTTPEPRTPSSTSRTTTESQADTTHRITTTDSSPRSTFVTQAETTEKATARKTTPSTFSTTNSVEEISTDRQTTVQIHTATGESFFTNIPVVVTDGTIVQNSSATRENPTTSGPVLTQSKGEHHTTLAVDDNPSNSSESTGLSRRKRSCQITLRHQDIRIEIGHIYKACNEIQGMKRVQGMGEKYLKSTIRLQMGFPPLKPRRNYFFMGRAVPGQDPADYVFMADELTVLKRKKGAWNLKKYLRSNGEQLCN